MILVTNDFLPSTLWLANSFEGSHEKKNMKIVDIKTKLIFIKF